MAGTIFTAEQPTTPDVATLLAIHLAFAQAVTPPEDVHALDGDGLMHPDITLFAGRQDGELLAVGALRRLDDSHVEVKSMHTAEAARGRGVGREMLDHLVATARSQGYTRISLETGMMPAFAAARGLYETYGFEVCEPFGQYRAKANSVCMTLYL